MRLFKRAITVRVGNIELNGLDCTFSVTRDLTAKPNKAELKIYNLNPQHRSILEALHSVPTSIEAGYENETFLIFSGSLRTANTQREGSDLVTTLTAGDGEKESRGKRVAVTFHKNAKSADVLQRLAKALGVSDGNLSQAISTLSKLDIFAEGTVIYGNVAREMTAVCRSLGQSWSVQNRKLQILPINRALVGEAVVLSSTTGLIGSPSIDSKGLLTCKTLLIPNLVPGRIIVLESERIKGQYIADECQYHGNTSGDDWGIDIKAKRY